MNSRENGSMIQSYLGVKGEMILPNPYCTRLALIILDRFSTPDSISCIRSIYWILTASSFELAGRFV